MTYFAGKLPHEEFNLSDFIEDIDRGNMDCYKVIPIWKIKEFIRRLKKDLNKYFDDPASLVDAIIVQLAGDKLIKEGEE